MSKKRSNKDKKDNIIQKTLVVFKKSNENEKRKSEAKKVKTNKPKGYGVKKFGIITFWLLFMFMFLVVFINAFSNNKASGEDIGLGKIANGSGNIESVEFTKDFLSKYYTWDHDDLDKEKRISGISYFVSNSILDSVGKVASDSWNSYLGVENILLKRAENTGENKTLLTFQIEAEFYQDVEESKKTNEDAIEEDDEELISILNKKMYVSVPLFFDVDTNRYVIYELPSYVYFDNEKIDLKVEAETKGLKTIMDNQTKEIASFLGTFFESYANDSSEKLSYFIEDKKYQIGLNGTMDYVGYSNVSVYEGKNSKEKIVSANVLFSEPNTEMEFTSHYLLVLKEKEGRYVVKHINNPNYITELKNNIEESLLEEKKKEESPLIEQNETEDGIDEDEESEDNEEDTPEEGEE